jgi:exopolysaccharide biosynthesis WecB/TagA/CpsF family protein
MVGSTEASLAAAAAALVRRHPKLEIALTLAPPMGFDPDGPAADAVIAAIQESGARLCYLALGAPKQERLAARAREALPRVGFLSIGAGLDFLSGVQRRAPRLARALAAEWVWRLASDPVRLGGRYAACIAVLPGLAVRAMVVRREGEGAS